MRRDGDLGRIRSRDHRSRYCCDRDHGEPWSFPWFDEWDRCTDGASRNCKIFPGREGDRAGVRFSIMYSSFLHIGRFRSVYRLRSKTIWWFIRARFAVVADPRGNDRQSLDGLERIRVGVVARCEWQRGNYLFDRKLRSNGNPYRRFDHGCTGNDIVGYDFPTHAWHGNQNDAFDREFCRRM